MLNLGEAQAKRATSERRSPAAASTDRPATLNLVQSRRLSRNVERPPGLPGPDALDLRLKPLPPAALPSGRSAPAVRVWPVDPPAPAFALANGARVPAQGELAARRA